MSIYLINTVSPYKEGQVQFELLNEHLAEVKEKISQLEVEQIYLIIPQGTSIDLDGVEVIEAPDSSGFTYHNHSALLQLLQNEKPYPTHMNRSDVIVNVEEMLGLTKKRVYVEGCGVKTAIDVDATLSLQQLLELIQPKQECKGIHFGYPMSEIVATSDLAKNILITTNYIELFSVEQCMLHELHKICDQYHRESCGRCVYGFEGATQLSLILADIENNKGNLRDIALIKELLEQMQTQSLCEVGMQQAKLVDSALSEFKDEIERHITKKNCEAGVCSKFVTFHILPDRCVGCGACMDVCEEEAILGKKRFIHVIDQDECVGCGACLAACEQGAIVKAGAVKPKGPRRPIPCKRR